LPLLFDIGANRGDATLAGLAQGYDVIAVEPSRIYGQLVKNFIYNPRVKPIKFAVSDSNDELVEFYEAEEDGLSTLNIDWLTLDTMPYCGKLFRTTHAVTITLDSLVNLYGKPDLIKIDVEGAEWSVFRGLTHKSGMITFEWTQATLATHQEQLHYLSQLGYTQVAPQFIVHHLEQPTEWFDINLDLETWRADRANAWETHEWTIAGLRPTSDAGMIWVK
jgi:FkbM family methyltransferase